MPADFAVGTSLALYLSMKPEKRLNIRSSIFTKGLAYGLCLLMVAQETLATASSEKNLSYSMRIDSNYTQAPRIGKFKSQAGQTIQAMPWVYKTDGTASSTATAAILMPMSNGSADDVSSWNQISKRLDEIQKSENTSASQEEEFKKSILNQGSKHVLEETITRFPMEQVKFSIATFLVQYHQLWLNNDGDPRRISAFLETMTDPISAVGFYFFMLGNGFSTNMLQKYGVKNLDIENRTKLFRALNYIGPTFGLIASSVFHDVSDTFKECSLARMKTDMESDLETRAKNKLNVERKCDLAMRKWHLEEVGKRYIPQIVGLAIGNLITISVAQKGADLFKKIEVRGLKRELSKEFARGAGLAVNSFDIALAWKAGKLVVKFVGPVATIVNITWFLGLDQFISPPIAKGSSILIDTFTFQSKMQNLEKVTSDCQLFTKELQNPKNLNNLALQKIVKKCESDVRDAFWDWRDLHNSWRSNINSEYETARQSYSTSAQNILHQYSTSQKYFLDLLQLNLDDQWSFAKLQFGLTKKEDAIYLQDHINRKYPFYGVLLPGNVFGIPTGTRNQIKEKIAPLILTTTNVALEKAQALYVSSIAKIMESGLNSTSEQEETSFLLATLGLYENGILNQVSTQLGPWLRANGFSDKTKVLSPLDQYQWIKENVFAGTSDEDKAKTRQFVVDVIKPAFYSTSSLWSHGLEQHISSKNALFPDEKYFLGKLLDKFHVAAVEESSTVSSSHQKLAEALLLLNQAVNSSIGSKPKITDPEIHRFLTLIRNLIGDPNPILVEGMAFPYIYNLQKDKQESLAPGKYIIPQKYPYVFNTAADYLNHEMICAEPMAKIEWVSGFDPVFYPPRVVDSNSDLRNFCRPQMLLPSQMNYELQYLNPKALFANNQQKGIIPSALANLEPDLASVSAKSVFKAKDEKSSDSLKKQEIAKILNWWNSKTWTPLNDFFNEMNAKWLGSYKKLQANLTRENEAVSMPPELIRNLENVSMAMSGAPSFPFNDVGFLPDSKSKRPFTEVYNQFTAAITERGRSISNGLHWTADQLTGNTSKPRVQLSLNLRDDLLVEWDTNLKAIKNLDASSETQTLSAKAQEAFLACIVYLNYQAVTDFSNKDRVFKMSMTRKIQELSMNLSKSIESLSEQIGKKYPQFAESVHDGLSNTNSTISGYMLSATLAVYDPEAQQQAIDLVNSAVKQTGSQNSNSTKTGPFRH